MKGLKKKRWHAYPRSLSIRSVSQKIRKIYETPLMAVKNNDDCYGEIFVN